MTARAAHLVDGVLPRVPVRQWVLTVPHRLRYLLAWNHPLCRAVLGVYARALLGFQRRQARRRGIRDGHAGSVTVLQRFGGGLNLTVHFHTLVLDGVFTETETGVLHFHPAPPPSDEDVARLLATIRTRVRRLLERRGLEPQDEGVTPPDPLAEKTAEKSAEKTFLESLEDGKTSKQMVILKLGQPSGTFEGERILTYRIGKDDYGFFVLDRLTGEFLRNVSWTGTKFSLVLIFDENNVLQKHSMVQVR